MMAKKDPIRRIDQRPRKPYTAARAEYPQYSLDELTDVTCPDPGDMDTIAYKVSDREWYNVPIGGHAVYFVLPVSAEFVPPGPTNITGFNLEIYAVQINSDGGCSGTISPGGYGFDIPEGGGMVYHGDPATGWDPGRTITVDDFVAVGDGNYIGVNLAVRQKW